MKLIRLLAAVLAGAATLVLPRRRPGRLRLDRAMTALRLAARGGPATRPAHRGCSRLQASSASCCAMTWPFITPKTSPAPSG
ncbi:MAG TPA: hypothetical protein VN969_47015 [Streptosporangiaceae bacterium]|jgi:hypothetical protein|nr:hypothetical protein [Streptosporangiaceae bacterium]